MATPALAWGDREQGALAGIVGTLIFQHIQRDGYGRQPAPVVIHQPPVVVQPAPVIVQPAPVVVEPTYQCPPGTRAFWRRGYMQDSYGRLVPVNYLECNS